LGVKSVEELENQLKHLYTNGVGVEFEHVSDPIEKRWLYTNYEKYVQNKRYMNI
jgi:2-oxoglutarate dehydrogenase complex dehydrogenase (E1) component-like enzyme